MIGNRDEDKVEPLAERNSRLLLRVTSPLSLLCGEDGFMLVELGTANEVGVG